MSWLRRLVNVVRSDRLARDAEREMSFHVAERVDELVAGGLSEPEARREARRRFGRHADLRDRVHQVEVLVWLESLVADVRYALRALRANPGFTAVAVLSLALGIGANTAIFSLINAVMLRSLPVSHPEELVQFVMGSGEEDFTNPLWESIRDRQKALEGTLAFAERDFNLSSGGLVRRAPGAWVSGAYFGVLGVPASRGRVLEPRDDVRGCPAVAVLGHRFWQLEYGGADDAIGRSIALGGHPFEIIGVAAPGFSGIHVGRLANIFVPLCSADVLRPGSGLLDARSTWYLSVFGRLGPGVGLEDARSGLARTSRDVFTAAVPTHWTADRQREFIESTLDVLPAGNGLSSVRGEYRSALFTLLVVVGVVLLIACANVAQLLMARATARQHEVAVRLALGSGRLRLVRQLLTESVLLALLGASLGALFARWSSRLVVGFLSDAGDTVSLDLSLDLRVLGFTMAIAATTGILFGLAPAWRSARVDPQSAIRGAGRGLVGESRHTLGKGLVIGQVALSLVLVVAAGLLVGSFRRLATVDPGFRSEGVLVVSTNWSETGLSEDRQRGLPREMLERLRMIPAVRGAAASLVTPISGSAWNDYIIVDGFAPQNANDALAWFNAVTDGFLETLDTRLLAGRGLTPQDKEGAARVILVNETLARRFFGDGSPLGRHIRTNVHDSVGPPMEVVGVVADGKYRRVDEETLPTAYVPLEQTALWFPGIELSLRLDAAAAAVMPVVTQALAELHPDISLEYTTLSEQVASSLARPRLLAALSGFFGFLALLLAVIGLYGTMSYAVARRRNEMGIRIALGSARSGILGLVAREAGKVVTVGVVLGIVLAPAGTRLIAAFLFGVTAWDPVTLAVSALVLTAVAMAAAMVPAWRAATVDPMVALREE